MPVSQDMGSRLSAQHFSEDFLNAGGLQVVVSVLQAEALKPEVNYTIRQGCYSICLQLARFLLCGQSVTSDGAGGGTGKAEEEVKGGANTLLATPTSTGPLSIIIDKPSSGSHAVQVNIELHV